MFVEVSEFFAFEHRLNVRQRFIVPRRQFLAAASERAYGSASSPGPAHEMRRFAFFRFRTSAQVRRGFRAPRYKLLVAASERPHD